jgi:hypothetical protein
MVPDRSDCSDNVVRHPLWMGALLALGAGCTVSDLDFTGRSCERAVDCPAPYVCVLGATQRGTCAAQGVETTDGGCGDVANVRFARDVQPIFTARCTQGGCHSAILPAAGLILAAPGTVSRLVNQPTSPECSALVSNVFRVKPGDPRNSMLWRKTSDDPTKCLDAMPLPVPLSIVSPCEFSRLEAWIQQGALDN